MGVHSSVGENGLMTMHATTTIHTTTTQTTTHDDDTDDKTDDKTDDTRAPRPRRRVWERPER